MPSRLRPGSRARFPNASAMLCGRRRPGRLVKTKKLLVTSGFSTHAASKLASDRVERSEFVWSAFGEFNSTGDDWPVADVTMLSFIPAASLKPNELPEITPVLRN